MNHLAHEPTFRIPPAQRILEALELQADSWQLQVLETARKRLLVNGSRQGGKTTLAAVLALVQALFVPGSRVLLLSAGPRQASQLYRLILELYGRLGLPLQRRRSAEELELTNNSRIICVPAHDGIHGHSGIDLLIIDDAAGVPDEVYCAVRPLLAVRDGRLICLSTPGARSGFFYEAWSNPGQDWQRFEVPAQRIRRINPEFLEGERLAMGDARFRRVYDCAFAEPDGLVYPDFFRCVVAGPAPPGQRVGGIDFGFRNPFAAVWGVLDRDGVLWLAGEYYAHKRPLSDHAHFLPRDVIWYCDPSGANERAELRRCGFTICEGINDLGPGIATVAARIKNGTLRIVEGSCPNLVREAQLYRYSAEPKERAAHIPIDRHNHALAAVRYLISRVDIEKLKWNCCVCQSSPALSHG